MIQIVFLFAIIHSTLGFVHLRTNHINKLWQNPILSYTRFRSLPKMYIAKTVVDGEKELFIDGPDPESKPDYSNIHGPFGKLVDKFFLIIFRIQFARKFGFDSKLPRTDFNGIIELTSAINARYSDKRQVQQLSIDIISKLQRMFFDLFELQIIISHILQNQYSHHGFVNFL